VSDLARALLDELAGDAATLGRLADALADPVAARVAGRSPWLSADEAAEYLRCPISRVRKLTATRELPVHHDGRRALYRREELDGFIRAGGAACP
jgi:excisionase family DNA binding protein